MGAADNGQLEDVQVLRVIELMNQWVDRAVQRNAQLQFQVDKKHGHRTLTDAAQKLTKQNPAARWSPTMFDAAADGISKGLAALGEPSYPEISSAKLDERFAGLQLTKLLAADDVEAIAAAQAKLSSLEIGRFTSRRTVWAALSDVVTNTLQHPDDSTRKQLIEALDPKHQPGSMRTAKSYKTFAAEVIDEHLMTAEMTLQQCEGALVIHDDEVTKAQSQEQMAEEVFATQRQGKVLVNRFQGVASSMRGVFLDSVLEATIGSPGDGEVLGHPSRDALHYLGPSEVNDLYDRVAAQGRELLGVEAVSADVFATPLHGKGAEPVQRHLASLAHQGAVGTKTVGTEQTR